MCVLEPRVAEVLRAHLVASVCRYHKRLHEEFIVEAGKSGAAVPSIDDNCLCIELLLYRKDIVGNF